VSICAGASFGTGVGTGAETGAETGAGTGAHSRPASAVPPGCRSLRRANPFLGLVAVVRGSGGRALSFDGRHWQLQVAAHAPRGLWCGGGQTEELRYFRFGLWSEAAGMTRVPLNPMLDIGLMLEESKHLVAALQEATPWLPFPLAAELELWLLDAEDAPLALLATAIDPGDVADLGSAAGLDDIGRPDWSAGGRGERAFRSPRLSAHGVPEGDGPGAARHAEWLERQVMQAAGAMSRCQWFRRDATGGTCIGFRPPDGLAGRRLPSAAFPALNLRLDWPDNTMQALVDDYFRWLSPYLLMLPDLDDQLRAGLEQAASRYAIEVSQLWRLYPRVLDAEFVRRARVEAQLRRAQA
jgi:hypothetical protein